ncbi:NAD-dependent epimerase/dehydratase family protein [Brachyspira hyodysenteriae]|uniref:NAD-dependent epimerase/dehydratase family protein n=1 Tax=Brachyspira hyodysenteriae TaxID=159 RepID=UPI0022CD3CFF|nr:NAD-dependent epimerase/dehydratase family protein [Brachyspira hyodysenteriae]MCZ9887878.1 NAD-dependent epimerase/dehydratase family protein [Brachyspira hyodysenteriae]MCZ9940347.1 NAD-dependent epimerase/dehydratase family protein [Brachyspira hyodysenteriae]MCZ9957413.1 NAD-dependent epimerase/dehydratase family protein [Brachyspira hyodysenteriae]MCZ9962831.1 NAD-dependent epimerase/dehydratase family protein [Brachyspira hyodysenteriae]MDA0036144.1 NAD-dependent epimerase/dehydratase
MAEKTVFVGTCFEYKFKDTPLKENDDLNPTTIYAKTKNYLREMSELYSIKNNIDFCWGRVFYTYGDNENPNRLFRILLIL